MRRSHTGLLASLLSLGVFLVGAKPFAAQKQEDPASANKTAVLAQEILKKNCGSCHSSAFIFDPSSRVSLIQRVVKPGDPGSSLVISRVANGSMPPDPNPKLSAADQQTLKQWIRDGAPDWNDSATRSAKQTAGISEGELLKEIVADLQATPQEQRPFVRYFSTANLLRNPDTVETIQKSEDALSKLVNSLSWSSNIVKIAPFGSAKALYRLDIRDVDWDAKTWNEILGFYPYGFVPAHEQGAVDEIRTLSGASVPYVRVDWFVSTASVPPLYHDILHLPDHVSGEGGLEAMLGVDAQKDLDQDKVVRAGLEKSGVSHNNRAVERHRSNSGYYYKSFDFGSNEGRKNIFEHPLDFKEDGGEFIWSLPNGMQAYLIAKSSGERLNVAPSNIVRDRSATFDDVNVTNGLSCISCHSNGMQFFSDEVRQNLDTLTKADFELDQAKTWYVPTHELLKIQLEDAKRFEDAVVKAGGSIPHLDGMPNLDPKDEPVTQVAVLYKRAPVTATTAAAECGLTPAEFLKRLDRSTKLANLGLGLLATTDGSIKRDVWEQDFAQVVDEMGLGESIRPAQNRAHSTDVDPRISVRIEIKGQTALAARLRSQLFRRLYSSDLVKPVTHGGDKVATVSVAEGGAELILSAEIVGQRFEAKGEAASFTDLANKLADDIHHQLAGSEVPAPVIPHPTSAIAARAGTNEGHKINEELADSTAQLLALALRSGNANAAISVDRGPGSTYTIGDEIVVRFSVAQDSFAAIYDVDSQGRVALLFPAEKSEDNQVRAGEVYTSAKFPYALKATGTPGRERMFLLTAPSNDQLPGVNALKKDHPDGEFISKSVGAFARKVQTSTQSNTGSIGASVVEFFTAK